MTAAGAGLYQLEDSHPSFGEGLKGYGKRFAAAYADQAIGNFMTEGVWPSLLRDDPRYFRRGTGSKVSRAWYAATRILVTRRDDGNWGFNYPKIIGSAMTVGISNEQYVVLLLATWSVSYCSFEMPTVMALPIILG